MTTWTTADEIEYIHQISAQGELTLADMLRLYIVAASRRHRWDRTVNPAQVLKAAESRLRLAEMMKEAA